MLPKANDLRQKTAVARERGWLRQDLPQILDLMNCLSVEYDPDSDWQPDNAMQMRWLKRTFNDPWHYFHVLRVKREIVAIAGLARSRVSGIDGHLHSVYTKPLFRGLGFGRRVTQGVIEQARRLGMSSLEMPQTTNPLARAMYLRMGFEVYEYNFEPHMFLALKS
ncbi:MAG: GNAT family N-acetyltransferase [Candidatus Obscuribacterales bacterium]|nr:GNAT family N-acetyltransferase [Candidatus Obscuribacterales bacterium]